MKKLEKVIKKLNLLPYLVILTLLSSGHINFNMIFNDFRNFIFVIILLLIFAHITFINKIEIPIYLSRVSLCRKNKPINSNLTDVQTKLINDYDLVKEGPNTDLLSDNKHRLKDYCHFSLLGFEKFSEMWVKSLTKK